MLLRSNYKSFSAEQLKCFTRLQAFECKVPKTKRPRRQDLNRYHITQAITSPCNHHHIPPQDILLSWRSELAKARLTAKGYYYVECEFGRYNVEVINAALQLHKAREIRREVAQEIDWFSESCRTPTTVDSIPSRVVINNFRSKIHCHSYTALLTPFNIAPKELRQLCCNNLLSSDHVLWVTNQLNVQQNDMYCVYGNSVGNFETRISRFLKDRHQTPTKIGVIYNVSKKRVLKEGVESWDVEIIRNFGDHGCHFATVILNKATREIIYGDSLGWSPPATIMAEMERFYSAMYKDKMPKMKLIECHDSTANAHGHECTSSCSLNYPLQNDGNICGVVAIFMLAFASLLPEYFQFIVNNKRGLNRGVQKLFFADPTRYGKYLRQVLMAWFSETRVSMKYLAPTYVLNGILPTIASEPSSDSDDDDVVHVEFKPNRDAKEDEGQDINEDDNSKQAANMKKTSIKEEPVVEMAAEENVVKSNEGCNKEPKSPRANQNNTAEATKTRKEAKVYKCKICNFSTSRGFNLRRHTARNHGTETVQSAEQGSCVCLECGHKCYKIADLRQHLSRSHGVVFRTTIKEFQSRQGEIFKDITFIYI